MNNNSLHIFYLIMIIFYLPCQAFCNIFQYSCFKKIVINPIFCNEILLLFMTVIFFYIKDMSIIEYTKKVFVFKKIKISTIAELILIGFCFIGIKIFGSLCFLKNTPNTNVVTGTMYSNNIGQSFFYMVLIPALIEEFIFRGVFYSFLRKECGILYAVLTSSIYFSLVHFSVSHLVTSTILGICSALFYEKTGTIVLSVILHGISNMVPILLSLSFVKNSTMVNSLFGNIFELPLIFCILILLFFLGIVISIIIKTFKDLIIKNSDYKVLKNIINRFSIFSIIVWTFYTILLS